MNFGLPCFWTPLELFLFLSQLKISLVLPKKKLRIKKIEITSPSFFYISRYATGVWVNSIVRDDCQVKTYHRQAVLEKKLKFYRNLAISIRLRRKFHKIYVFIDMREIGCIAAISK